MKNNDECFYDYKKKKKGLTKEVLVTVFSIIAVLVIFITNSYAIFTDLNSSSGVNHIKAGTLNIVYDDTSPGLGGAINLNSLSPKTDIDGSKLTPYRFKLTNDGDITGTYKISIANDQSVINKDNCADNLLTNDVLRFKIANNNGLSVIGGLNESHYDSYIIEGRLAPQESVTYELNMWIKGSASLTEYVGKHYHGKIVINSSQLFDNNPLTTTKDDCFTFSNNTITDYDMSCGNVVVIPTKIANDDVLYIGDESFANKNIEIVDFTNSYKLIEIKDRAFINNKIINLNLENATSLTKISAFSFSDNNIHNIVLSSTIGDISSSSFVNNDVNVIVNPLAKLFDWSSILTGIPGEKTSTGNIINSFDKTTSIVTYTNNSCFTVFNVSLTEYNSKCGSNIVIPNIINGISVYYINKSAFKDIDMSSIYIENGYTTLEQSSFMAAAITNVRLPDSLLYINDSAFKNNNLGKVTISKNVTTIANNSFSNNKIEKLELDNNITYIGYDAFSYNNLSTIILPSRVGVISPNAFYKSVESNPLLTTIINPTSKPYDWGLITGLTSKTLTYGEIIHPNGNINITNKTAN